MFPILSCERRNCKNNIIQLVNYQKSSDLLNFRLFTEEKYAYGFCGLKANVQLNKKGKCVYYHKGESDD